jgi:hypothetical protein
VHGELRRPGLSDLLHWVVPYIDAHERESRAVGKPHVIEEFNAIMP